VFDFIKELNKIEIEYNYNDLDGKYIRLKSYIKSVESDHILIDFLSYGGTEYNIPVESWITVKFKEKTGVYSGDCQILDREDNSRLPGLKISYPANVAFIQQREYVRVSLKLKMKLLIFPEEEEEEEEIEVNEIITLDISGSGFCFTSNKPVKKHSKITGIINLPNQPEKPLELSLKNVYSKPLIAAGKEIYKNAFTYTEINEKDRDKILKEVFLYELELRKKGI
jgi:c-di-GMP-binding flagellar brake protein YcgR